MSLDNLEKKNVHELLQVRPQKLQTKTCHLQLPFLLLLFIGCV